MKDKVMIFIIGLLVGAVIASGAFLIYTKANNSNSSNQNTSENVPSGMQGNMGTPPEKPDGSGEPPAKPGENAQSEESTNDNN